MLFKLFLLFTVVPAVELSLLIYFGGKIGVANTVAIVIFTAALGAYMVRREGLQVLYRLNNNVSEGVFPAEELLDGVMLLVAGALLLTPGFLTDVLGFFIVFPASRRLMKSVVRKYLERKISSHHMDIG